MLWDWQALIAGEQVHVPHSVGGLLSVQWNYTMESIAEQVFIVRSLVCAGCMVGYTMEI